MDKALREEVRTRSGGCCEYCCVPDHYDRLPFQIDHIIAEKRGGPSLSENLAWSCYDCNIFKGPNIAGVSSEKSEVSRLFHPRKDIWSEHFSWSGGALIPKSDIGCATINVLRINLPRRIDFRQELINEGVLPVSAR